MKNKTISGTGRIAGSIDRKRCYILLILYIAFLFGFCVLCREVQEAMPRPGLFRSYRAAWNGGHLFPFARNIIFNILMYTPVGFFLCGSMGQEEAAAKTKGTGSAVSKTNQNGAGINLLLVLLISILLGFAVSMAIEDMQMRFHKGTYETDDVLNNTFGALLGASWMIMLQYRQWRRKLAWITGIFLMVSLILLSRTVWLCWLR